MLRWIPGLLAACGLVAVAALDVSEDLTRPAQAAEPAADHTECITRDTAIRAASRYVADHGGGGLAKDVDAVWSEARWTVFFWDGENAARDPLWVGISTDGRITGCDARGTCSPADTASAPSCDMAARAPVSRDEAERIARDFLGGRLSGRAPENSLALWSEAAWLVFFESATAVENTGFVVEVAPDGDVPGGASGA